MWLDLTFDLCSTVTPASHLFGFSPLRPGDQNSGIGRVTLFEKQSAFKGIRFWTVFF